MNGGVKLTMQECSQRPIQVPARSPEPYATSGFSLIHGFAALPRHVLHIVSSYTYSDEVNNLWVDHFEYSCSSSFCFSMGNLRKKRGNLHGRELHHCSTKLQPGFRRPGTFFTLSLTPRFWASEQVRRQTVSESHSMPLGDVNS